MLLNVIMVVAIATIVATLLSSDDPAGRPRNVAGYAVSTVLTESMADVYPKDSLVVAQHVDPETLQVGDDITFMVSGDTSYTHRIVEVLPSYGPAGEVGFRTQGTRNPAPDSGVVMGDNVVGKIVFSSPEIGAMVVFAKGNWPLLVFLVVVALVAKFAIKRVLGPNKKKKKGGATVLSGAPVALQRG